MKAHVSRRVFRATPRLGLALLALPALAGAADLPMELSRADAGVQVNRTLPDHSIRSLPAQPGMALQPLDVLMTNAGRASLQVQGAGLIQAGPNSEVILHSGESGGPGRTSVARLQLLKGPLHIESRAGNNRLPPDVRLNVGTGPNAIRSRIYGATVEAQNTGPRQTVCLSDGAMEAQINGTAQRVDSVGQCLELTDGTLSRPTLASRPELIPGGAGGLDAAPAIETSAQARARVQPVAAPPSVTTTTTTTVASNLPAPVLPVPGTLDAPPASARHPRTPPAVALDAPSRPVVGDPYSGRGAVAAAPAPAEPPPPKALKPAHPAPAPSAPRPAPRPVPQPVEAAATPPVAAHPARPARAPVSEARAPREREESRPVPAAPPPKPAKPAAPPAVGPAPEGAEHYALIVGSLSTREAAETEAARFRKKGVATTVEEAGPNRFRLRAGGVYGSHPQAAAEQARLQAKGVAGWISPR